MEQGNFISNNWYQQEKIFIDNLLISRKRPTKDSAHDLRVAIKRMRSYLRLKQKLSGDNWKEHFAKTSALFKSFGKLRDFDMALTLLRQWERNEHLAYIPFKQYLLANRILARRWAKQDAINYTMQELDAFNQQFDLLQKRMTDEEICNKILLLSQKKIKKVNALEDHFKKNAHEIRKQLKNVYYWLKICPPDAVGNLINLKELDKMLNYLGSWQDHFMLREKINQFIKELPADDAEKKSLKSLEKKLIAAQDELLQKAMKKWKEVLKN